MNAQIPLTAFSDVCQSFKDVYEEYLQSNSIFLVINRIGDYTFQVVVHNAKGSSTYVFGQLDVLVDYISNNLDLCIKAGLVLTAVGAGAMASGGAAIVVTIATASKVTIIGASTMGVGVASATLGSGSTSASIGVASVSAKAGVVAGSTGKGFALAKLGLGVKGVGGALAGTIKVVAVKVGTATAVAAKVTGVKALVIAPMTNVGVIVAAADAGLVLGGLAAGATGVGLLGVGAMIYYKRSGGATPATQQQHYDDDDDQGLEPAIELAALDHYTASSTAVNLATLPADERAEVRRRHASLAETLRSLQTLIIQSQSNLGQGNFGAVVMRQGGS